jgi:hypothetical protein
MQAFYLIYMLSTTASGHLKVNTDATTTTTIATATTVIIKISNRY